MNERRAALANEMRKRPRSTAPDQRLTETPGQSPREVRAPTLGRRGRRGPRDQSTLVVTRALESRANREHWREAKSDRLSGILNLSYKSVGKDNASALTIEKSLKSSRYFTSIKNRTYSLSYISLLLKYVHMYIIYDALGDVIIEKLVSEEGPQVS